MPTEQTLVPHMIDVREVARILNVSPRTVWRLVSRGDLPPPGRFGRSVRWRAEDICACINKRIGLTTNNGDSLRHVH